MRDLARKGKVDPLVRIFAATLVRGQPEKAWFREIRTLFDYVREEIRYTLDINNIETLQEPRVTLQLKFGDCDDKCILLGSMLECIGHPARFAALAFEPDVFSHVIVQTLAAAEGQWISLDTTEPEPIGWFPPGVVDVMRVDV